MGNEGWFSEHADTVAPTYRDGRGVASRCQHDCQLHRLVTCCGDVPHWKRLLGSTIVVGILPITQWRLQITAIDSIKGSYCEPSLRRIACDTWILTVIHASTPLAQQLRASIDSHFASKNGQHALPSNFQQWIA
ncbi:hypothetical protein [Celerinatantimonas yamalensis]|uniref:Uncharacterized protein n=1 Tax=Celerinatantimonas yamalensis TaxID=559956 RepID=A0ABW9G9V3_9GAMM